MSVLSLSLGKKTGRLPERRRPAFPMVALALLFSLLALLPLGFVVAVGFDYRLADNQSAGLSVRGRRTAQQYPVADGADCPHQV